MCVNCDAFNITMYNIYLTMLLVLMLSIVAYSKLWIFYMITFFVCYSCVAPTFSCKWNKEPLDLIDWSLILKDKDFRQMPSFTIWPC